MGIPFYVRSLIRSHPEIERPPPTDVDVLALDFNCFLHRYLNPDEPIGSIVVALDSFLQTIQAKRIYIAFDGLVPVAKMVQQRYRRMKHPEAVTSFDKHQISPGTPYMRELADTLEKEGVEVKYAIHPVAGRMPGHMNVLLAEANVPYDALIDMEDINPEFPQVDVVLVLGANDVVNPSARHMKSSPIYGMPILDVDKAACVMVVKRSMRPGFAGVENELFFNEKTLMVFGDAKDVMGELITEVAGNRDSINV
jgi:hypothetical protein